MASAAKASAPAAAVAKVQAAARKAGHAWNEHDARCIGDVLDAAITRRRNFKDVKVEYGCVRIRFDLRDDGELEVVEEKDGGGDKSIEDLPAGDSKASQRVTSKPPGLDPQQKASQEARTELDDELKRLRERAAKASEAKRRQKKARATREEAKRKLAAKYVAQPYGSDGAAITTIECPLWSTKLDLKTAFVRVVAEVTQRLSLAARGQEHVSMRGVSARFGGKDYQVSVLDSTFAAFVEADELAEDLLVVLADGLTEERLVALLKRWSKAWRRKPSEELKEMDQLD